MRMGNGLDECIEHGHIVQKILPKMFLGHMGFGITHAYPFAILLQSNKAFGIITHCNLNRTGMA